MRKQTVQNKAMAKNKADKNNQKGQSVTVYINGKVVELINQDAKAGDRSFSYIVNRILEKYYTEEGRIEDK